MMPTPPDEPLVYLVAVYRTRDGWSRRTYRVPVAVMRELADFEVARKSPRPRDMLAAEVAGEIEQIADTRAIEEW